MSVLRERLAAKIPAVQDRVRRLVQEHGDRVVSEVTVAQILGGARGVRMMTWEPSLLDPEEGIRFRGLSIPEVIEKLPRAEGSEQPLPEAHFFLLLTGDIPTAEEAASVRRAWARRNKVPLHVWDTLDALPKTTHPMSQFTVGIMALGTESEFARAYAEGIAKADYWKPTYEDAMTLLARLPQVAAYIYRRTYRDGQRIPPDVNRDWGANFAYMLGVEAPEFAELMRLYLVLHSDHEGGNVSAHTTRLVGSALSDAYLAFAAAMNGLAGPLHGLANQEVLRWILEMQQRLGDAVHERAAIERYVWDTLESGRVIPGYGHAVLRKTDPRYTAQRAFALKHMPDDPLFRIVSDLYQIVPRVLKEQGKAKNPWPNVDAHSGALLWHYGIREYEFYTVLFGLSRALGVLANLVWDRALGLPLERPKSTTTRALAEELAGVPRA